MFSISNSKSLGFESLTEKSSNPSKVSEGLSFERVISLSYSFSLVLVGDFISIKKCLFFKVKKKYEMKVEKMLLLNQYMKSFAYTSEVWFVFLDFPDLKTFFSISVIYL